MQSKHNVLKIVDVSLLTSFYHSIEKKAKIWEILCFLKFKIYTTVQTMQKAQIHTSLDKTCITKNVPGF